MNIIVTGRHMAVTDNLRDYAQEKVRKFDKYLGNISEAVVTLSVEKYRHKAEVLLKVNGMLIQAEGITGEMYSSIDKVVEKLNRQVKKYKEKLISHSSHRKGEGKTSPETSSGSPMSTEFTPTIIKRKRFDIKPMNPEEAAAQMDLLDKDFFVFTNASTGDINVLYKRRDGNLGLIEPSK
ncbi:MAG: ribosome-associated translation inhibitor RaiA [Nitrospirae bacterium]|nr:ribosome-associated translation inhibitor RaiA [Nitrospirota bacterium]